MMGMMIFLITNIAVMLTFGLVMIFVNIQFDHMISLMVMSGVFGFGGSIISLLLSKYIALLSVSGRTLKQANNKIEHALLYIVRNQSHKLGIKMPQIAIYSSDDMNAFATGACRNSALIAVSTGLLKNMTYSEVEAVIAHEMSHISSRDMVIMTLIQGIINTFVIFVSRMLAKLVSSFISIVSDDNNEYNVEGRGSVFFENNSLVYFVVSMVLESVFGLLASIITFWFSRYREFYADAGSAKLVGCEKMIAALEKLKLSHEPTESNVVISFCINGRKCYSVFHELFRSHPSLDSRIKALRCGYYLNKFSLFHND